VRSNYAILATANQPPIEGSPGWYRYEVAILLPYYHIIGLGDPIEWSITLEDELSVLIAWPPDAGLATEMIQ
jgi:hypothetical protein